MWALFGPKVGPEWAHFFCSPPWNKAAAEIWARTAQKKWAQKNWGPKYGPEWTKFEPKILGTMA